MNALLIIGFILLGIIIGKLYEGLIPSTSWQKWISFLTEENIPFYLTDSTKYPGLKVICISDYRMENAVLYFTKSGKLVTPDKEHDKKKATGKS